MSAYVKTPKHSLQNKFKINLKYQWEKILENGGKNISIFCAGQFQFDAIYSMILDFASWSVYWQLTSLFTSGIGQLWNLARLNDVRGISMISAKTGDGTIYTTINDTKQQRHFYSFESGQFSLKKRCTL